MIGRPTLRTARHWLHLAGALVTAVIASAPLAAPLGAQRVLGPGEDAYTLPRGAFRVGISGASTVQRDEWRDGALVGIGGVTGATFGPAHFSLLGPLQQIVRDLGVPGFAASLGAAKLDARQRLFVTPLSIEYGVADWLTVGVSASLVRSKAESQFRVRGDSARATLGPNPIFLGTGVAGANLATIGRFTLASASLTARRNACQLNSGAAPECPTLLAELAAVNTLAAGTSQFAAALATLYGAGASRGQRYVPVAGSTAETLLLARVDSMRLALLRYGITDLTPGTGLPLGAQTPLTASDLDRLMRDSTDGFGARPLRQAGLTAIGDVDVAVKIRLVDSFSRRPQARFTADRLGWRQAVIVGMRIGTGTRERADEFLDQGSGSGTNAFSVRSLTDLLVNDRFWTTLSLGVTKGMPQDVLVRVPSAPGFRWLESWREAIVPVTPGALVEVELAPRWQLSDYLALGAQLQWRRRAADRHEIDSTTLDPLGNVVPLLGSVLDAASSSEEQRIGWSATYSTLAAHLRGRAGIAFEISYSHVQSLASGEGIVPKRFEDRLQVRYYPRFLAR